MGRRLALLADSSHEGPWTNASGDEASARVRGLGVEDSVWMHVIATDSEIMIPLVEGLNSLLGYLPEQWRKYRVCKAAGNAKLTTCVEVLLG